MQQPGLHQRHRTEDGEIAREHGEIRVKPLRRRYGADFARGFANDERLKDVLATLDEHSLSQLVQDHEQGDLAGVIASAQTAAG